MTRPLERLALLSLGGLLSCDAPEVQAVSVDDYVELRLEVERLRQEVEALQAQRDETPNVFALEEHLTVSDERITLSGANVYVQSGSGRTDDGGELLGRGNLIVGYAELPEATVARAGSHNLIVGEGHDWPSYAGIIGGYRNVLSGPGAVALGGEDNTVTGRLGAAVGGRSSYVTGEGAAVLAGNDGEASGPWAAVAGGQRNTASGLAAVASGGSEGDARSESSAIFGGTGNVAIGAHATVSGGTGNTAQGDSSMISGTHDRVTTAEDEYIHGD